MAKGISRPTRKAKRRRRTPKGYVSHSQLLKMIRCGRLYKAEYYDGVETEASEVMKQGSVVHGALATLNRKALEYKEAIEAGEEAQELGAEDADAAFRNALRRESGPGEIGPNAVKLMKAAVRLYAERVLSNERNLERMIGYEFEVQVPYKKDLNLLVIIDRIDDWGDDGIEITDYKWSFRPLTGDELREDQQLNLYAYAAWLIYPNLRRFKLTHYMLRQGQANSVEVKTDDLSYIKDHIDYVLDAIGKGRFEPRINPYCHTCPIRSRCPAYRERFVVNKEKIVDFAAAHKELAIVDPTLANLGARRKILRQYIGDRVEEAAAPIPVDDGLREWGYWEGKQDVRAIKSEVELFRKFGLDIVPLLTITSDNRDEATRQLYNSLPQNKIDEFKEQRKKIVKTKKTSRLSCRNVARERRS